mmetsp:Transcript_9735/g.22433  ORF Transcript_9735/g.22433 Transcript_9735/m.22433 type:complete len:84 (+) Transcript_9735:473-724(+)
MGPIPTEIGDCHSLETLIVDLNDLNGTIPTEMGRLENLSESNKRCGKKNVFLQTGMHHSTNQGMSCGSCRVHGRERPAWRNSQ